MSGARLNWSSSLRVRVAAASSAGALLTLVVASGVLSAVLTRQQYAELDRRVEALSRVATPLLARQARADRLPEGLGARLAARADAVLGSEYVAIARRGSTVVADISASGAPSRVPLTKPGLATVATGAGDYRLETRPTGPGGAVTVTVGLPVEAVRARTAAIRRTVLAVGALAVLTAAALGLLLAGAAVRPLRQLRERVLDIGRQEGHVRLDDVRGAREVEELAGAVDRMQHDLAAGRRREEESLAAARDFAAAAGHELRTPLTALRTDLAVLGAHPDLTGPDREALLSSLDRAQHRLDATLTALGQLARGDLADPSVLEPVDLSDVAAQAVADARVAHPGLSVSADLPATEVVIRCWPAGVRLALGNLLANAAIHGAREVRVTLGQDPMGARLLVDDDGPGVPPAEREAVLGRFVRGAGAAPGGSGLGLALVAQQAAIVGGHVRLLGSPQGGLRVELFVPRGAPPRGPGR